MILIGTIGSGSMLDTDQTITHIYSVYDKVTRTNVHKKEVLTGSWFRKSQVTIEGKSAVSADAVIVRIPVAIGSRAPVIKVTDCMVLGNVDTDGKTIADIKKAYPECFEVQSVTYNMHSVSGYSNHVRVSGS